MDLIYKGDKLQISISDEFFLFEFSGEQQLVEWDMSNKKYDNVKTIMAIFYKMGWIDCDIYKNDYFAKEIKD